MNDLENPDLEAGAEVVEAPEVKTDGEETNEEGQVETQPEGEEAEAGKAKADEPDDEAPKKTRHQRRKEYIETLKENERRATDARDRITAAGSAVAEPKEDDYEDYTEFQAARAFWRERQRERAYEAEQATTAVNEASAHVQKEVDALWASQVQEARGKYQDFEKVALVDTFPVTPDTAEIIKRSDHGADILYHLGLNPAIAAQIASLPPIDAAVQIGRIEATLQAPTPPRKSNAPEPIKPVRANAAPQKDPAKMSTDEYRAWRQAGGTF